MKVVVSVLGRFHAFDLCRELARQDALEHLFTSYPRARAERFGIPAERVTGRPSVELLNRTIQRIEQVTGGGLDLRGSACAHHDQRVASGLRPGADVFVGWSGSSLASLSRARELGMLSCVERGSTHILHQEAVLEDEYERLGIRGRLPARAVVDRELAEYESADRIVVPTRFVAETFYRQGIESERLIQVPYGVSLDGFVAPVDGREAQTEFTLMHCGNVSIRKGCHYLLQAFEELRLPAARLVFVGPVAAEFEPWVARCTNPRVSFTGRVAQADLLEHYATASAFCLASLEEGMAMVVPQAMACGLPIIATRESGAAEAVREGREGKIVAARSVEDLKQAICELYEDRSSRLEMGERALARVATEFTWKKYGERILRAYRSARDERFPTRSCA